MEEQKPIKPFKTISLVDRLKGTIYDKDPEAAALSNKPQGSPQINTIPTSQNKDSDEISLPRAQLTLPKEGALLKNIPEPDTKESVILKGLADGPQAQYPTPQPSKLISLTNSTIPPARTRFASTLSLANRLKQPTAETGAPWVTTALPQYFLSDLYTGYLEISRFITEPIDFIQNRTQTESPISTLQILQIQDPDTPISARVGNDTVLIEQGTFFSNNTFFSVYETEPRLNNDQVLQLQGTFFLNGQFISLTAVEPLNTIRLENSPIPPLEILAYETDRLLAIGAPKIKHGSGQVTARELELNIAILQGMIVENQQIVGSIIEPDSLETLSLENSTIPSLDIIAYETDRLLAFSSPKVKHGSGIIDVTSHNADRSAASQEPETKHGAAEGLSEPTEPKGIDNIAVGNNKALLDQIEPGERVDTEAGETPTPFPKITGDTNLTLNQFTPTKYETRAGDEGQLKQFGNTSGSPSNKKLPADHYNKALPIVFKPEGGSKIVVPCYLTSFSDGFSANWNDITYVGRQDTLKQFTGVTRALSFAILVPSFNPDELTANMAMLNKLADATVIGNMSGRGKYISGPLCKIRIGSLINSYCAFSSMKWDFDPAEATTDLDNQLPHLLKVAFDGAVLADRSDRLLGSKSGQYFGEIY